MKSENYHNSRRDFIRNAATAGVLCAVGVPALLTSCGNTTVRDYPYPPLLEKAPDGKVLKAGVVGCGYRGTGAAINFLNAGDGLEIAALGDLFDDQIQSCRKKLKENKGVEVDDRRCFIGFDAFEKVIDCGVDVVILATPPHFRPQHLDACVKARKHVFMEKPIAVDPVGVRSVMISGERAKSLGLSIVTGTIKRHQKDYVETFRKVNAGEIGQIVSANSYYNVGKLWHKNPRPQWSQLESMIRNWVNWCWLSGDHIVEQHVHNLDVVNWFVGDHPQKAIGFGARHRRITGDQYDLFSVDFMYDSNVHYHSMCRQINDCSNNVSDIIRGTKGFTNCHNTIFDGDGEVRWKYKYPRDESGEPMDMLKTNPYDQEHIDLVTSIRTSSPINETRNIAESTLTAIMGRVSAYTGKEVTWDEMLNSDLYLGPKSYVMGPVNIKGEIPKPGTKPNNS